MFPHIWIWWNPMFSFHGLKPGLHCSWMGKSRLFLTQRQPKLQTYLNNLPVFCQNQANKSSLFSLCLLQGLLLPAVLWAEPKHCFLITDHREGEAWGELHTEPSAPVKAEQEQEPVLWPDRLCMPRLLLCLLGAKMLGFLVCNKINPLVSQPSELLPDWHFIINAFFSMLVLVSGHFTAF